MSNQSELDEILDTLAEKSADSDSRLGYVEAYEFAQEAKQAILDWHNKQIAAVLDRLTAEMNLFTAGHDAPMRDEALEAIQAERDKLKEKV